jgi:3-hydroxymyristoyl/3-hydroxydecanoyl-(acyl carrier protein) dehydratase
MLESELRQCLSNCFTEIAARQDSLELVFFVPADLPYFQGHFPVQAILPGVAMLEISLFLASQYFSHLPKKLFKINRSKFVKFILPNEKIKISIALKDSCSFSCKWTRGEETVSSMQIFCK